MTMRPQAGTFGTYGPPTGPALVLVDDEAAGATTTLRHAGAGYASVAEADGDAVCSGSCGPR